MNLSRHKPSIAARLTHTEPGQATIELVLVLPLMILLAVIAFNCMVFFTEASAFDRTFRNAVRTYAVSPSASQSLSSTIGSISSEVTKSFNGNKQLTVSTNAQSRAGGLTAFTGTLTYRPTLFGRPLSGRIFGYYLPAIKHSTTLVVSTFKTGVFI